jgi:hypothetical protein
MVRGAAFGLEEHPAQSGIRRSALWTLRLKIDFALSVAVLK